MFLCFFQSEDVIRDLVRSRGLGDVDKRQRQHVERLEDEAHLPPPQPRQRVVVQRREVDAVVDLSLLHI